MGIKRFAWVAALALGVVFGASAQADELTAAKRADLDRMLEMTGALAVGQQMSAVMVQQLKQVIRQANPGVTDAALDSMAAEVDAVIAEHIPSFREMSVLLYHKYFTHDEVKQMIVFYSSDLGRKTIQVMPMLLRESMTLGQQWGNSLAPEIRRRVRDRLRGQGVEI